MLQAKFNIADDQTDGFTRGLMVDFEKDFKVKLQDQIKAKLERLRKEQEKSGEKGASSAAGGEKGASSVAGSGSQLGGAMGAS